MDDLIRRQDAVKSMTNAIWHYPNEMYAQLNSYEMAEALAKDGLKFIPSAQQWIPCSERLPDIDEDVLTCDSYGTQGVYTLTRFSDDEVGWEDDYGFYQSLEDVPAWMPLPERYREETES